MTLKINPESTSPKNKSHGKTPKTESRHTTEKVSKNCDAKVEKLFLNQSILPLVSFFQK